MIGADVNSARFARVDEATANVAAFLSDDVVVEEAVAASIVFDEADSDLLDDDVALGEAACGDLLNDDVALCEAACGDLLNHDVDEDDEEGDSFVPKPVGDIPSRSEPCCRLPVGDILAKSEPIFFTSAPFGDRVPVERFVDAARV